MCGFVIFTSYIHIPASRGKNSEADYYEDSRSAKDRAKTAPEKKRRKNWLAGSVNIKTARGEKVNVKAPGNHIIKGLLIIHPHLINIPRVICSVFTLLIIECYLRTNDVPKKRYSENY